MSRAGRIAALLLGLCLSFSSTTAGRAASAVSGSPFSDWAAVVVAGDWHAHSGGPSEAFDNARRDVAKAFRKAGFDPGNLREFSVRPERYRDAIPGKPGPGKSDPEAIYDALRDLTGRTSGGCLIYFSSHGSPQGVLVDQRVLPPAILAAMLDDTCGQRPTVVIVSACFSGVFIPDLALPNRMVLTAARPDRSSFGCGEADRYPFFDDCILGSMPKVRDFPGLARQVRACVAERELREGMSPPSEPQVWIGPALRPLLPLYTFAAGP